MRNGSRQQVAVVDDDDAVRDSLRLLLETAGFSVATFGSAAQFLREAEPAGLKCLLIDQHMPEVTGLQLATTLRERGIRTPIALITGSVSSGLFRQAHELGIDQVMEKPLDDDALVDFINRADS